MHGLAERRADRQARGDAELADARPALADDDRLLRVTLDDDHRADQELGLRLLAPRLDLHRTRVRQLLAELMIELLADDLLRDELRRAIGDHLVGEQRRAD